MTFLILSPGPAWQSVNSRKQTLLYVFPSDPHTGSYSLSQFPLQDSMEEIKMKSYFLENERAQAITKSMHFRKYPSNFEKGFENTVKLGYIKQLGTGQFCSLYQGFITTVLIMKEHGQLRRTCISGNIQAILKIQSNSVISNSSGPVSFVRYIKDSLQPC